jgi:type IV secretory pathway VirJ component
MNMTSILIPIFLIAWIAVSMGFLFLASRVTDFPLPHNEIKNPSSRALAVIFSGGGGWIRFDEGLAGRLAEMGFDVLGMDSLRYFFLKKKSPAMLAADLSSILQSWCDQHKTAIRDIVLIGYAKGADVLPFAVNLLRPELRSRIRLVTLMGIGRLATFRISLTDLFSGGRGGLYPAQVGLEIKKMEDLSGLCIYGDRDRVSLCRNMKRASSMEVRQIQSGAVFHDFDLVANIIGKKFDELSLSPPPMDVQI